MNSTFLWRCFSRYILSLFSLSLSLPLTKLMNTGSERLKLEIFKVYSLSFLTFFYSTFSSSNFFVTESVLTTIHAKKSSCVSYFPLIRIPFPFSFFLSVSFESRWTPGFTPSSFIFFVHPPKKFGNQTDLHSYFLTLLFFLVYCLGNQSLIWRLSTEKTKRRGISKEQRRSKDKKDYGRDKCFLRQEKCCGPFYPGLDLLLFGWEFFLLMILVLFSSQEPCVSVERLDLSSLCSVDFSSWVSVSSLKHPFLSWKLTTWLSSLFSIDWWRNRLNSRRGSSVLSRTTK